MDFVLVKDVFQVFEVERLWNDLIHTNLLTKDFEFLLCMARDTNYNRLLTPWHVLRVKELSDILRGFKTIHFRHAEVCEYN